MSDTVDVGIDLGTTNSAVVAVVQGEVQPIRNNDNQDITPSAVQYLSTAHGHSVIVGAPAYARRLTGDPNTFTGFKRSMGKGSGFYVPALQRDVMPEELSSEILKSLRADAEAWMNAPVGSAVITVPAAFELAQCDATQRAAKLAGIEHAPLLQEPIAAALAYGYQQQISSGYFLVYDLGGGTFDTALLRVHEGKLTVIDHEGDNFFGGRDWDGHLSRMLMEKLTLEGIPVPQVGSHAYERMRSVIAPRAERAKIALSRKQFEGVVFDEDIEDANGDFILTSVDVNRSEYNRLIEADIERSITIIRELLIRQQLEPSAVDRLILVGGPTYTPILREMLSDRLGIELETRLDPMLVVATGAARFAASVPLEIPRARTHVPNSGALYSAELKYAPVTESDETWVGGRIEPAPPDGTSVEIERSDRAWTSGRMQIQAGGILATVALAPGQNSFTLTLRHPDGVQQAIDPASLVITRGVTASNPPLAQSISLVVLNEVDEPKSHVFFEKGLELPVSRREKFRSTKSVRGGITDNALDIRVLEGEFIDPKLDQHVGLLRISGLDVKRDLPQNSEIEVSIRIDESRILTISAFVPLLDQDFSVVLQDFFMPDVDPSRVESELRADLVRASELARKHDVDLRAIFKEASLIERDLDSARAGNLDDGHRAERNRKRLAHTINEISEQNALPALILRLEEALKGTEEALIESGDAADRHLFDALSTEAASGKAGRDSREINRILKQLNALQLQLLQKQPRFWVDWLIYFANNQHQLNSGIDSDTLIARGRAAVERQDWATLRAVCTQLWQALPGAQSGSGPNAEIVNVGIRV